MRHAKFERAKLKESHARVHYLERRKRPGAIRCPPTRDDWHFRKSYKSRIAVGREGGARENGESIVKVLNGRKRSRQEGGSEMLADSSPIALSLAIPFFPPFTSPLARVALHSGSARAYNARKSSKPKKEINKLLTEIGNVKWMVV
jgi:hypothetical protein